MSKATVGVVGYGSFGKFLVEKLSRHTRLKIIVNSLNQTQVPSKKRALIEQVAQADFIVLAIPFSSYPHVLQQLQKIINPDSVIIDIASIKEAPMKLIREYLPSQRVVATHPLFGPQSAGKSLKGHTLILCSEFSSAEVTEKLEPLFKKTKLKLVRMTAIEHDQLMAKLQALTFFTARALDRMGIRELQVMTPSYMELVDLAKLEHEHSEQLFQTIQNGNRFASQVRKELLSQLTQLDDQITQKEQK